MKVAGMEQSCIGPRMGGRGGVRVPHPIMAQRALFIPNLRGEAPEGLAAGKYSHVSLCLGQHDSWYQYVVASGVGQGKNTSCVVPQVLDRFTSTFRVMESVLSCCNE